MENTEPKPNKKLIGIILVVVLVAITGYFINKNSNSPTNSAMPDYFADSNSWKEFNSVEGAFKVSLPTVPTHQTNSVNIPNTNITGTVELYSSEKGDSTYFIQAIRYAGGIDVSNPQANLEGAFNGRASEIPNHKVISSKFGNFISNDSLDYLVQSDKYYIYGKMILVDQRMYSLEMACEMDKCSTTNYQTFINSFQLQ